MKNWEPKLFKDIAQFPPKVPMEKGKTYSFIPMEDVSGNYKYVAPTNEKEWTGGGGAKFENGDTLFARITPCLQNGKIAQAKDLKDGKGFGSTEYFIFRGINKISDSDFIYYIAQTDEFRKYAIGSMVGASGRQRADAKFVGNFELKCPPLTTQRKIASILSAYDDLIENNLMRIKLLEEIAQRTYEEWFVKFRIHSKQLKLNKETGLPEGWEEKVLGEIITKLESGSRPKGGIDKELKDGIPSVGAESVLGLGQYNYGKEKLILESFYEKMNRGKVEQKDILVYKDGAYIGKTSMFQDEFPHKVCVVNEHVFLINTGDEDYQNYLFFTLNRPEYFQKMQSLNSNSAQPGINQEKLNSLIILVPKMDIIKKYSEIINPSVKEIFNLAKQNHLLKESRDILLPRLMSGVIGVEKNK